MAEPNDLSSGNPEPTGPRVPIFVLMVRGILGGLLAAFVVGLFEWAGWGTPRVDVITAGLSGGIWILWGGLWGKMADDPVRAGIRGAISFVGYVAVLLFASGQNVLVVLAGILIVVLFLFFQLRRLFKQEAARAGQDGDVID